MNKKIIDQALSYYEISDKNYKEKCYKCLDYISNNKKLEKEFNDLYQILFIDKTNKIRELWKIKKLDELFTEKTPDYITNLLLLSGYKIHQDNQEQYNLDDEQVKLHKLRVKESLINDVKIRKYNQIRLPQMLWGAYFINVRLIEVGRLQYEKCEDYIKIHIPATGKLDIDEVRKSLANSKKYIEKYFGLKNYNYYCNSWLLSNQIHNMVDENSNIYKFYNLFEIKDGENCIDDILNFVYQLSDINNYNELEENTSLQRMIKKFLLQGLDLVYFLAIILLKEKVVNYIYLVGLLYGLEEGFYYSVYNIIESDGITNEERAKFAGTYTAIESVLSIIFPVIFGSLIYATSFLKSLIVVFVLVVIRMILSFIYKDNNIPKSNRTNMREYYKLTKKDKRFKQMYKVEFLNGLVYSEAAFSYIVTISMIFTILSLFFMIYKCNAITIILFNLFQTISKKLKNLITGNNQANLSNDSKIQKEYKTEYWLANESSLVLGRIISSSIFILIAYTDPTIMIIIFALFLIIFAINSVKLQKVIEEGQVK